MERSLFHHQVKRLNAQQTLISLEVVNLANARISNSFSITDS
jgi:hypothetical protein